MSKSSTLAFLAACFLLIFGRGSSCSTVVEDGLVGGEEGVGFGDEGICSVGAVCCLLCLVLGFSFSCTSNFSTSVFLFQGVGTAFSSFFLVGAGVSLPDDASAPG